MAAPTPLTRPAPHENRTTKPEIPKRLELLRPPNGGKIGEQLRTPRRLRIAHRVLSAQGLPVTVSLNLPLAFSILKFLAPISRGRAAAAAIPAACLIWVALPPAAHASAASLSNPDASTNSHSAARSSAPRVFWAVHPVQRPAIPSPAHPVPGGNAVDQFLQTRREAAGLEPSAPAPKDVLLRRLSFDLTGLPPSPEALADFLQDERPDAYERRVDQWLARPEFGERWAQHWLDVVRYAESEGFEYDRHLPDGWRFRDYVVAALNSDKPYREFLHEQIAGDELDSASREALTASIFHRLGPVRRNAGNPDIALSRNEVLTERTDIIASAFLGVTLGCARCHNHKLDPFSQRDYYQLQAYLAATDEHNIILDTEEKRVAWEKRRSELTAQIAELRKALASASGEDKPRIRQKITALDAELDQAIPTIPATRNNPANRTPIHILKRGVFENKGESVRPRPPGLLGGDSAPELAPDAPQPRTALAQWLSSDSHPLTARVFANRIWQHHFGIGLVSTSNDFGTHGDPPSHPELLDWLASELIHNGWRPKAIHRAILLSAAYRQSSNPPRPEAALRSDPQNRLLWKFSRRRLSAEEMRDSMLAVSGALDRRMSGPSVFLPVDPELVQLLYKPSQWKVTAEPGAQSRRSLYLVAKRNLRLPFLEVLDHPTLLASCARRESSTHAPQALELLNGRISNELARLWAESLKRRFGDEPAALVDHAYRLAVSRPPNPREKRLALEFLKSNPAEEFTLALFNLNAFIYVD